MKLDRAICPTCGANVVVKNGRALGHLDHRAVLAGKSIDDSPLCRHSLRKLEATHAADPVEARGTARRAHTGSAR